MTQNSTTFPNLETALLLSVQPAAVKPRWRNGLGDILDLPVIELDALHWMPGWTEKPWLEIRAELEPMTRQDRWITDGNYSQVRDLIWPRADTIIWLDYPFLAIFLRLFIRTLKRVFLKVELWNGNRERFRDNFLSRDSLFVWLVTSQAKQKRNYPIALQEPQHIHLQVLHFNHPRQTERWLTALKLEPVEQ